jgi:pimeloyl-ACP methyl ester carboxylesterase
MEPLVQQIIAGWVHRGSSLCTIVGATVLAVAAPASAQSASKTPAADWAARAGLVQETTVVATARGFGARLVTTRPVANHEVHRPGILFIPWLSCDPVEVPGATDEGYIRFVRDLSVRSRMIVVRVEKPGVAGSPGPDCAASTLDDDFAAFHAGLAALRSRRDVDMDRIFLVGGSIGGAFAVVLAAESPELVAGVVSVNSFARTWYEHMIDHERRRLTLAGTAPDRFSPAMRAFESLYSQFLIGHRTPGQVLEYRPELRSFWYDAENGQYGRSAAYFQQVEALDVDGALASLGVPALFIGGEYDWVMGSQEPAIAAARVNRYHPGRATAHVYPGLGHGIQVFASAEDSYHLRGGRYEPAVAADVARWLEHASGGR